MPNYDKRIIIPQSSLDLQPISLESIPTQNRTRFLNPGEIEVLCALVRAEAPLSMVEFGCQNGRTARVLLDNVPTLTRYLGIDVPPSYVTPEKVQRGECPANPGELAFSDKRFRLLMAGRGSRDLDNEDFELGYDVAFIDGDHSYDGVLNDFHLSMSCTLVIFHDDHLLGTVGVNEALDKLADMYQVHHVDGTWISYIKP